MYLRRCCLTACTSDLDFTVSSISKCSQTPLQYRKWIFAKYRGLLMRLDDCDGTRPFCDLFSEPMQSNSQLQRDEASSPNAVGQGCNCGASICASLLPRFGRVCREAESEPTSAKVGPLVLISGSPGTRVPTFLDNYVMLACRATGADMLTLSAADTAARVFQPT